MKIGMKMPGMAALALIVAACASSSERPTPRPDAQRQAAQVNASLGREYMGRGQYEVALEKLKKAIAVDPSFAPAHTLIAVLYEQIGEPQLAERHYGQAVELAPDNGDVNNNYGVFLCGRGRAEAAEAYFLRAVEDPFYATPEIAFANAGSCMLRAGQVIKSEKYLRQSLEYKKDFPDALLAMAGLKFEAGEYLNARAFLQRFEAAGPVTAESLWLGYRLEQRLGDTATAQDYGDRLLREFPESRESDRLKGAGAQP